ncbi:MAG: TonB-dependent receptor [Desulfobacteraceae bacterium]|nr:TonB-dependent receptor [Desulfobacteraceae bacterium]
MEKRALFYLILLLVMSVNPLIAKKSHSSQVFDLGEVVVTEQAGETVQTATINEISIDDIKMQGVQTVAQALELTPGVNIRIGNKGQSDIKLRGFDQNNVKILIDGVPSRSSYFSYIDLGQIPIDSVAKIKIIKGASSVLYGSNTMGGVINIITKKGGKKPHTSLTTSFGQNDTQNYIFNHGASSSKINYWVTASHRKSDGYELSSDFNPDNPKTGLGTDYNEDGGIRDLSYYTKNTLSAKLGYEYDKSELYLSFDYHDNKKGCPTERSRYWEYNNWNQWHVNLVGKQDITQVLSMKARAYYIKHDDTLEDISWDADHTTGRKWFEKSSWDDYTSGGEVHAFLDFGKLSFIKMGISYVKDNHISFDYYDADTFPVTKGWASVGMQPEKEYEMDTWSYGIEDEILLLDNRLTLKAGVSYDVLDPIKATENEDRNKTSVWNPQAGIAFNVTKDLSIYTSIGKKTRFPTMGELYSTLAGGNSSLKPQKTIAYEVGLNNQFNNFFNCSLALFFNDVADRIMRNSSNEYINKGKTEIKGLEAQMGITTPWDLDLGFTYTWLASKDQSDAGETWLDSEYLPEHKAVFDARYVFDFGLSTSFQSIYTGEQIEYDGSDKVTINDFIICNVRLNQNISFTKKMTTDFFVEVKNIFDENYDEGSDPAPGRSFLAGITITF